jgi:hypothetical protein
MFGLNDNNSQPANDNDTLATDAPAIIHDHNTPADSEPAVAADIPATDTSTPAENSSANPDGDNLLSLKQQALQSLQPLVGHLDQTPEEKFKTTMMLIQATDNSALVKEAYEAANRITDEKLRAQALLDIVNEINYFTQQADDKS